MKNKILLVEDNLIIQTVIADMLELLNCEVDICSSGNLALKKFKNKNNFYDLILTDIDLGKSMSGDELAKEVREFELACYPNQTHRIPMIGMTSNLTPDREKRCLDKGIDMLFKKPLSQEQLEEILKIFLKIEIP